MVHIWAKLVQTVVFYLIKYVCSKVTVRESHDKLKMPSDTKSIILLYHIIAYYTGILLENIA